MNLSPAISEGRQVASKTHGRDHQLEEGATPHADGLQLAGKASSDL